MPNHVYIPESAMAIVAHPDDIEFSCAGTMADRTSECSGRVWSGERSARRQPQEVVEW